ncbi:hypothetical protein Q8791_23250 [Nocardiopsis sp. CT-R113]|uniref:Uncharacterized protein n=1 Tax=Nocardiopsis codii TaxID=3065942 RepID=A0ABU7KDZ7_9ACTN|nr:hypothetical protein [Nocardiopsis sp. CT-R113]MEE2040139.1 hypothetical protein [Nocardiopsis sp. CT-R113]
MPLRFVDTLPAAKIGRPHSDTPSWGAQYIPELMDNPGTWAELTEAVDLTKNQLTRHAAHINRRQRSWADPENGGRFRAAMRTVDGRPRLFVRYETRAHAPATA